MAIAVYYGYVHEGKQGMDRRVIGREREWTLLGGRLLRRRLFLVLRGAMAA